jgi:hypothetical protein
MDGVNRLVSAMILQAIKDMRARPEPGAARPILEQRTTAILWLVSTRATRWFDCVGINQVAALERVGWEAEAEELLDDPVLRLKPAERRLLRDGICHLAKGP